MISLNIILASAKFLIIYYSTLIIVTSFAIPISLFASCIDKPWKRLRLALFDGNFFLDSDRHVEVQWLERKKESNIILSDVELACSRVW